VVDRGSEVGGGAPEPQALADRWIASRVTAAIEDSDRLFHEYDTSALADLLYHLIFDDFCDWYLELLKAGQATPAVAAHVLEQILALAHPVIPFVTEDCWSRIPGAAGLMLVHPPPVSPGPADRAAEGAIERLQEVVTAIRALRAEAGLPPREPLAVTVELDGGGEVPLDALAALGRLEMVDAREGEPRVVVLSFGRILVHGAHAAVDVRAEASRLGEALERLDREIARADGMLGNPGFVDRAPADVVEKEREKLARFRIEREELARRLAELEP